MSEYSFVSKSSLKLKGVENPEIKKKKKKKKDKEKREKDKEAIKTTLEEAGTSSACDTGTLCQHSEFEFFLVYTKLA